MSFAYWLNRLWQATCRREAAAFRRATADVRCAQATVLSEILAANQSSAFGREHRFDEIRTPQDYQSRVPLASYEDLRPWIQKAAAGQPDVLTGEPILLFQPTSGSTGGEKLIPYTRSLRRQYQRGIAAWIADLFSRRPQVCLGRAYWSISPALGKRRQTEGGTIIGFDDDSAYLGWMEQFAVRRLLVAPSAIARCTDIETFRYATLLYLIAANDVSLISVWNPSFLTVLLDSLAESWEQICWDLRHGCIRGKRTTDLQVHRDRRRADCVANICRETSSVAERARQLWPNLMLVSCWGDASAENPMSQLQALLPHVEFQAKGLLATEGFVSFPLVDQPAPALSARSHFFEFLESNSTANRAGSVDIRLAHELEEGRKYQVVLTTGGGLYRYHLRDEIQVVGHLGQCPLLRFLGKSDNVVDLVGEKLEECHVSEVLARVFQRRKLTPRFVLMTPCEQFPPGYRLFVQLKNSAVMDVIAEDMMSEIQQGLESNPHYRYAVGLRQLAPLEMAWLDPDGPPADKLFADQRVLQGHALGNIKPTVLDRWPGWCNIFQRWIVAPEPANHRSRMSRPAIQASPP